ncbi:hypothetical protein G4B88_023866 [Cannabis sativa]|uniref:Uncharacterized protein n=1 Tax=Cannabis sativa TaxID=3483 RepID=A0A7J6G4R6_CANSA|nr:hypothetical protein G4B88_023866 [Cannabis sativa]
MSQKNQDRAADVVSRPARIMLVTISRKNSGEFNSSSSINLDRIKSMNLLELISTASAKAFISSSPEPPPSPATAERQPGSTSKANLQILSKANLSKTSCKSIISPVSEAFWRIGSNLVSISKSTLSTTKFLNDLVLNS